MALPSINSVLSRSALTAFFLGGLTVAGCAQTAVGKLPAGVDLQLGGSGSAAGKFADLVDTAFDSRGQLWTVEGSATREAGDGTYPGNSRVQVFDGRGQFVRQFSLGTNDEPAHIAVNASGTVYVSFPAQDRVTAYDANGRKTQDFAIPGATGLTTYRRGNKNIVAAIGGFRKAKNKGADVGGDRIFLLDGTSATPTPLSRDIDSVDDISADDDGNFYVLGDVNSIYIFDATGKLRKTIGAGTATKATDGSELQSSVAVAPDGEIYSIANSFLARFDAQGENVTRRAGTFAWYEPWNISLLALDPTSGRVWATSTALVKSKSMERYHYRPVIMRLSSDYFAENSKGTIESSTQGSGLKPQISSAWPLGVATNLQPFRVDVNFPAATRGVSSVDALYKVYDAFKNVVAQGNFTKELQDGQPALSYFRFTPPAYGAYSVDIDFRSNGKSLTRVSQNFGVTPPYANLPKLSADPVFDLKSDAERQMFAGLPAVRLSVTANPKSWDALEKTLDVANRSGANVWVQFTEPKDATPEVVRAVAQRFKGRVKVYEIVNEPDLKMKADAYLNVLRPAAQAIGQVDPNAQIMGPACVNIRLAWYKEFFDGGGGKLVDIVSFHDYEGNESIDPMHWKAKITALRDLMQQAGIGNKPLWQTERAIPAVRANTFSGLLQAIRINAHDDILQSLGIPAEHNLHYYLNESGYASVPSYMWSQYGPHPAVFVERTRYALTKDLNYAGSLDFGSDGNKFLSGLRYSGAGGDLVALRTQNTSPQRLRFTVRGASSFQVLDCWGNEGTVAADGGVLSLELGQLPTYVRVPRGASLNVAKLDFGRNLAPQATFGYTGDTKSNFASLTNGIFETIHGGITGSNNRGTSVWKGELPDPGIQSDDSTLQNPPALTMTFPNSQTVSTFVFYGLPSDNGYSALVDFDVQVRRGANWQTAATVRGETPPSEAVGPLPTLATSWASDNATFVVRLPQPIAAREWRLVPRRVTFGVAYDAVAARAMKQSATNTIVPALWLREVEVYGE